MAEEIEVRGTYKEIAGRINGLNPTYNHLEVTLIDLEQSRIIEESESGFIYSEVTENYERFSTGFDQNLKPFPHTKVTVCGSGAYPIGKPWRPLTIKIYVDGHSHMNNSRRKDWPKYFDEIKNRIADLVSIGYVIKIFEALRNQKDDFPGDVDADEILKGYANEK